MRDQIQRKIEGRDEGAGTDGEALDDRPIAFAARINLHGQLLAADARGFFRRQFEGRNRPLHFAAPRLEGLAGLECHEVGEFFGALRNPPRYMGTGFRSFVCGHVSKSFARPHHRRDRLFHLP